MNDKNPEKRDRLEEYLWFLEHSPEKRREHLRNKLWAGLYLVVLFGVFGFSDLVGIPRQFSLPASFILAGVIATLTSQYLADKKYPEDPPSH